MKHNKDIIHLIPKRKKGVLNFLFSRLFIIIFLIFIQLAIFFLAYIWLNEYIPHFTVFQQIFSIGVMIYLFNCKMDSSAKLTWLTIIMLFPIPSTLFLCFTKNDIGQRAIKKRIEHLVNNSKDKLKQDKHTFNDPLLVDSGTDDLCRYLNLSGCFPIYENTETTYFPQGEDKFEAMLEELRKAENFIFMEYFIIEEGYMWGKVLSILKEKAEMGVDVRVMFDGMCEISTLSFDYPERMKKIGIKCKAFFPIKPFFSTHYNYRDHRKILVIDGKTAFTGGVNLADEYINKKERFGHWKDTAIMLKGEAVSSFTLMFLQMWNITEAKTEWDKFLNIPTENIITDGFVLPYADCPLDEYKVGENVYMDMLNRAKSYVHIMTPYLILDSELQTALTFAAQRGVDVKIILPGKSDKKTAYALAKSHYKTLTEAGVKIFEYTPGFIHAKTCISDDIKAVVGTINFDYRSLYHHFECAAYLYRTSCISEIEDDFQQTLSKCQAVTMETIKNEKLFYKFTGIFLKIFSPLM
mgnify:CR=1 FL=1